VDIIYIRIKICGVYGAYLRVYEVLSVSLGLVLIPCVNALACQPVGNVEFCRMLLAGHDADPSTPSRAEVKNSYEKLRLTCELSYYIIRSYAVYFTFIWII